MFESPPTTSSQPSGSTSRTLLERVRLLEPDAWNRFVHLYGPAIFDWCERAGLQNHDAADVTQEVLRAVSGGIASFRRERPGDSFRGWLRTIAANKIRDHFRSQQRRHTTTNDQLDNLPAVDPDQFDSAAAANTELAQRAFALIQSDFEPTTAQAFYLCVVDGLTPRQAAAELGLSVPAVYKAKSRVLNRLRQELDGLLD